MLLPLLLALAQAPTAAPQTATAPVAPAEKPKMVCMKEGETGSRLSGKRVCRTPDEWELIKQQGRAWADRARNTGNGNK